MKGSMSEILGAMELFYILIVAEVTQLYAFDKTHSAVHQKG